MDLKKSINKAKNKKIYTYYSNKYKTYVDYYYWIYSNKIPGYMSYGLINDDKVSESVTLAIITWSLTFIIYGILNLLFLGLILSYFNFSDIVNLTLFFLLFFLPIIIFPPVIISMYPKIKIFREIIEYFCKY